MMHYGIISFEYGERRWEKQIHGYRARTDDVEQNIAFSIVPMSLLGEQRQV
jgi:hypothetical protein